MSQGQRRWTGDRIPPAHDGVQLNACRNVLCANFGVVPINQKGPLGDGAARYRLLGTTAAHKVRAPAIMCVLCSTTALLVSNAAISEEYRRLEGLAVPPASLGACKTATCPNHEVDAAITPEAYHRFGHTAAGSPRFRCRLCGATFSKSRSPTHRLRRPTQSLPILKALINKVPMRRLCDLMEVSPQTLYHRIGWLYDRCRAFSAAHEQELWSGSLARERLHIAFDRQEHILNSGSMIDRRPIMMQAAASTDAYSGYVLLQNLNFDPDVDPFEMELAARDAGDPEAPRPFRRYGRLVMPFDDEPEQDSEVGSLISRGMAVHEQIAIAAHLTALSRMTRGCEYVQLTLDREPGIERTALLSFADRVKAGTTDIFLMRMAKIATQAMKRQLVADAATLLAKEKAAHPGETDAELLFRVIEKRYQEAIRKIPEAKNRWVEHPFQTMGEPQRAALCLTDDGERPRHQIVRGFARTSLRSLDRYFMQVRRKIHVLERPISTSSQANRRWYGYSAYSPLVVMRLLEIFRVVYNYHLTGEQETTPAQRMGLASSPYGLAEILDGRVS